RRGDGQGDSGPAHRVYVLLLPQGLRRDAPASPGEEHVAEHLGGLGLVPLDELDRSADGRRRQLVSPLEQREQLLEEHADAFGLVLRPGDGDLIPPDHDDRVERGFHELEQLVALPEEGDHRLVAGYEDLHLGGGSRQSAVFGGWTPVPPCWWPVGRPLQKGSSPDDPSRRGFYREATREATPPSSLPT